MVYCKGSKVVISADYHGTVVITSEIQCKLKEVWTSNAKYLSETSTSAHMFRCSIGNVAAGERFIFPSTTTQARLYRQCGYVPPPTPVPNYENNHDAVHNGSACRTNYKTLAVKVYQNHQSSLDFHPMCFRRRKKALRTLKSNQAWGT